LSDTFKGAVCGIVAAVSYGTNPLFSLHLYAEGMTPESVLFYRFAFATLILGLLIRLGGVRLGVSRREVVPLMGAGVVFAISSETLYVSFLYMDAGIACSILFMYPILVALLMILFFGERASVRTFACLVLACTGIGLLYKGNGTATLDWRGLLLVAASSLSYAVYIVGVSLRKLSHYSSGKLTFWVLAGGTLLFFLLTGCGTRLQPIPASASGWVNTLGVALVPTVIPIFFINKAIKTIGPTPSAIMGALEPITALIIGVLVFHESLTPRIVIGCVLIFTAVILVILRKDKSRPAPASGSSRNRRQSGHRIS
jgi:drug/metabolite transporter (DMT)-like permease